MNNSKSIIAIVALLAIIGFLGWFFWEILVYMFIALVLSFLGTPLMRLLAKIKAKIIGAGNPMIRSSRFRLSVFRSAYLKSLFLNALIKYSKP